MTSFTLPETAYNLRCSVREVRYLIASGELVSFPLGGKPRVSRTALEAFQNRREAKAQ